MLREFKDLVNETIDDGYQKGITLFVENLETDMSKDSLLEEKSLDDVMTHLFTEAGVEISGQEPEDDED